MTNKAKTKSDRKNAKNYQTKAKHDWKKTRQDRNKIKYEEATLDMMSKKNQKKIRYE